MSDRVCVRGCVQVGVHWATCENNSLVEVSKRALCREAGEEYTPPCKGCAPRECRDGSLICDTCFGRARALLSDAPDLLGRLRAIADPAKSGWNWEDGEVIRTSSPHPPAPIGDDLIDAIHAVEAGVRFFGSDITDVSNDADAMGWLGPLVLDRHVPDADGVREGWSVRDAVDRWGVERKDSHRFVFPGRLPNAPEGSYARFDEEEDAVAVPELHDTFLDVKQAAARAGVGVRAVQKWAKDGHITPVAKLRSPDGNVHTYFRTSDIDKKRTTNHIDGRADRWLSA